MDSGKSLPTLLDEKVGWTDQIRTDNLSDSSVTTPKIADSSVTTPKIADDAVTIDKLDDYVETTLLASVNRVDLSTELTDVDEAGDVRHMKICLRHTENTGSTFDVISPSLDTATTYHDGLMAGEDKQQLDAHEADLKAIHKVTDNLDTNYLRRDGKTDMTGNLVFSGSNAMIEGVAELNKTFTNSSGYSTQRIVFTDKGVEFLSDRYSKPSWSTDLKILTATTAAVTANGFQTYDQSYYGLLTNNGAVLAAMSDTDITSVANAVFGA